MNLDGPSKFFWRKILNLFIIFFEGLREVLAQFLRELMCFDGAVSARCHAISAFELLEQRAVVT